MATEWSFLTNHGRALLCIAHDPDVRLREVAAALDITERRAYAIVADLTAAGYVLKKRDGRRNRYAIQHHRRLPEPTLRERTVGEVLELLVREEPCTGTAPTKMPTRPRRSTQKRR
jgi:DNA-binding transcriptional ArsR family regulator